MGAGNSLKNSRGKSISAYLPPFRKGALVYGENIQSGVLVAAHFAGGLLSAVVNGSITSAKIGVSAVGNTNIKANAIRAGAISAKAVTSAKIGVSAVGNTNIKANAIRAGAVSANAITSAKIKAKWLSGTISGLAAGAAVAVAHGLAVKPKFVVASMLALRGEITAKHTIAPAGASASTSTNIYLVSSKTGNVKYAAYVQA